MIRIAFYFPIILFNSLLFGQSAVNIRGRVSDSVSGEVLEDATVTIYQSPGFKSKRQMRCGKNGFLFTCEASKEYMIITSYEGYAPDSMRISFKEQHIHDCMLDFRLQHSVHTLVEVLVHAAIPPVILKNDTIQFDTRAFPTPPNSTIEDLLMRMPGIEIDRNGNVTLQGKRVDKILLDGKEFVLNDIKTATQNLPADIVAHIDAFDTQTDREKLTGIKSSGNSKTLNIGLKKDKKRGFVGKLYAGIGSERSYSIGGTITRLASDNMLLATVNSNNINNQFNGQESNNGPGSGGIQSISNGAISYNRQWQDHWKVTINAGMDNITSTLIQTTFRKTIFSDSFLLERQFGRTLAKSRGYNVNALLEYMADSSNSFIIRFNYSPRHNSNDANDSVTGNATVESQNFNSNAGLTSDVSSSQFDNLQGTIDFRHKFGKQGQLLFVQLGNNRQTQRGFTQLNSSVHVFDSSNEVTGETLINQQSTQSGAGDGYGGSISYIEPVGENRVLDFSYQINHSSSTSRNTAFDFDTVTKKYDLVDTISSNYFASKNTTQLVGLGYNLTQGKFRYQLGMAAQTTELQNNNLTGDSGIVQHFTDWFPKASFIYSITRNRNLTLSYAGNSISPGIDQLQPIPDLSNPLIIKRGNPGLEQQFNHNFSVSYASFDPKSLHNFQLSASGSYFEHKITNSSMVESGGIQEIQYINIDGAYNFNLHLTYGLPLGKQQIGNINFDLHSQVDHDVNMINGNEDIIVRVSGGGRTNLSVHPIKGLFFYGSAGLDLIESRYSIFAAQNTNSLVQNYEGELSYELPLFFILKSNYIMQMTSANAGLPAQQVTLWNAAISKTILADHSLELRGSAFNILNNGGGFTQTITQNFSETSQTNLLKRFFLFSLIYHFNKFSAAK